MRNFFLVLALSFVCLGSLAAHNPPPDSSGLSTASGVVLQGGLHWQFLRWHNGYFLGFNPNPRESKTLVGLYSADGKLLRTIAADEQNHLDEGYLLDATVTRDGTIVVVGLHLAGAYEESTPIHGKSVKVQTDRDAKHPATPVLLIFRPNSLVESLKLEKSWPRKICAAPDGAFYLFGELDSASLVRTEALKGTLPSTPLVPLEGITRDWLADFRSLDAPTLDVRMQLGPNFYGEWLLCSADQVALYHAPSLALFELKSGEAVKHRNLERALIDINGDAVPAVKASYKAKAFRGAAITPSGRIYAMVEDVQGGVQLYELRTKGDHADWIGIARWPLLDAPYRRLIGSEGEALVFIGAKIAADTAYEVHLERRPR